jgi:hypothetical protein
MGSPPIAKPPSPVAGPLRTPADAPVDRWMGVGRSADADGMSAGAAAARQALSRTGAKLLIVFCSDAFEPEAVLAGIDSVAPGTPLVGCSTAGEITAGSAGDGSVVVLAIGGPGFDVATAAGRHASAGLRFAGANAAECLGQVGEHGHRVLLLLTDGRAGDQNEVIRGVHEVAGSGVPLAGGCAGDGVRMSGTFQLLDGEVLRDAVVAAAIRSDGPLGLGWSHGWRPVGEPVLVTRSEGNRVVEIGDEPALDRYLDHFGAPAEVRDDAEAFTKWARVHPLGLARRRTGEQPVRCVSEADFAERSLVCTAEVPQGGLAWFMHGDAGSVLASTRFACDQAIGRLDGAEPLGLIAFNCIGRRGILGDDVIDDEAELIAEAAGAPIAGLYTYGEIARTRGVNAVHSQTLAVLALG